MDCNINGSSINGSTRTEITVLVAMASTGLVAVVVCALGVLLVFTLKLYKVFIYRLSLYLVISGMASGAVCVMDAAFVNYYRDPDTLFYRYPLCLVVAFLLQYSMWVKLVFTVWTTFHLFAFSICFKNLKRLELLYLCSALVFPVLVSIVPFSTKSYGLAGQWCWIVSTSSANCTDHLLLSGLVEQFALWFVPSSIVLVVESAAVVVMIVVLVCRVYSARRKNVMDKPYKSALKQMLPLLAYPITWCALSVPTFADRLFQVAYLRSNGGLVMANAVLTPGWNVAAGMALVVHIWMLVLHRRRRQHICCNGYQQFKTNK